MNYKVQKIDIGALALNQGQIEGLPANPRQWTREDIDKIAASLRETPELFEMRPCIVTPHGEQFVILAGSLRFCGARQNGDKDVPCIVFEGSTDKMREIVIKDNGSFGAWDADSLANEWDGLPLADWGVPAWIFAGLGDNDLDLELRENGDGSLMQNVNDEMQTFQMTFLFPESVRPAIEGYCKEHTKEVLSAKIIEICQSREAK